MESARKEKLEQRGVLVLLAVFAIVLVSTLRGIGLFGHKPAPGPMVEGVSKEAQRPAEATGQHPAGEAGQGSGELAGGPVVQVEGIAMPAVDYVADMSHDPLRSAFYVPEAGEAPQSEVSSLPLPPEPEPTIPAAVGLPSINIQGVLWGSANPQVIIDGKVYEIGDSIGGGRILSIERDGVTVERWGATFRAKKRGGSDRTGGQSTWEPVERLQTGTAVAEKRQESLRDVAVP